MINPKITKIIQQKSFNPCNIQTYLLSLYYGLEPEYVPDIVKKQTYITGIINRDFKSGSVLWTTPLFKSKSSNPRPTKKPEGDNSNWEWVDKEYRQMFITINKEAGADKQSCIIKMKKFFEENPKVTKENVIKAARLYLRKFEQGVQDPKFLQQANYFIFKGVKGASNYQSRLSQFLELVDSDVEVSNRRMRGLLK